MSKPKNKGGPKPMSDRQLQKVADEVAAVHRARHEAFAREKDELANLFRNQSIIHLNEMNVLAARNALLEAGLAAALSMARVAHRGEWTVACESEWQELQKLVANG